MTFRGLFQPILGFYDSMRLWCGWVQLSLQIPASGTGVSCFWEPDMLAALSSPPSWRKGSPVRSHLPTFCHGSAHREPQLCTRGEVAVCIIIWTDIPQGWDSCGTCCGKRTSASQVQTRSNMPKETSLEEERREEGRGWNV